MRLNIILHMEIFLFLSSMSQFTKTAEVTNNKFWTAMSCEINLVKLKMLYFISGYIAQDLE